MANSRYLEFRTEKFFLAEGAIPIAIGTAKSAEIFHPQLPEGG
jgi:hypothetical protein